MIIANNFLFALGTVLGYVLELYIWIVIIRSLLTWVNADPRNPLVQFLVVLVDPVTRKIRRAMPFLRMGMVDISPLVLIFFLFFLKIFVVRTLIQLSM
ncbi:MAG: YggT family protein [Acidobacteria bacterium]|nr:YggT family protein [Acidobacteriota bacterium]